MKISIIGLGLIGGSLGLALKESAVAAGVQGWDHHQATVSAALERGAIDCPALDLPEATHDADLVVVATPVATTHAIFAEIAPYLKPNAIVTDVGSTKAQVMAWAAELLPPQVKFIGGHPMAGSERHGIGNARADLFHSAVYCLTPDDRTTPADLAALESLVVSIGATPLCLPAAAHDAAVAAVSHLPFVLSAALVQITTQDQRWPEMSALAATGYRDLTRLASGDPMMHRDICLTNGAALQPWLRSMAGFLNNLADRLDDGEALHALFDAAKQGRDAWLRDLEPAPQESTPTPSILPDPALTR